MWRVLINIRWVCRREVACVNALAAVLSVLAFAVRTPFVLPLRMPFAVSPSASNNLEVDSTESVQKFLVLPRKTFFSMAGSVFCSTIFTA